MHTRTLTIVTTIALLTASTATQTVTATIRAATPLTVMTNGPVANTQTLPIGPLPASGQLMAIQQSNFARTTWQTTSTMYEATTSWDHLFTGLGSAGPHDIVVEWSATSPIPVDIDLTHWLTAVPGTPVPQIGVDIGNDGSFEAWGGTAFSQTIHNLMLTPQPMPVLIRFQGTGLAGTTGSNFTIRVRPHNSLQILPQGNGCLWNTMAVRPSFQSTGVVALSYSPPINVPSVLVLGLAPQPTLLPALQGVPCILLPRPDALIPLFATFQFQLDIPAAVRPVDVWMQRAGLISGQLYTSDAFWVRAF